MPNSSFRFPGVLWAVSAATCFAQPVSSHKPAGVIQVSLENRVGGAWQTIDPQTVLHSDDTIRFRFRSSVAGFLYVVDGSSEGESASLFPYPGQNQTNRVEPGTAYIIPEGEGSFVVGGKPGYDAVYWIVSPGPLEIKPERKSQPSTLEPRCREEVLKSRGLCFDERAGPAPVRDIESAPFAWKNNTPRLAARDLKFQPEDGATRITAAGLGENILVCRFLIAHR